MKYNILDRFDNITFRNKRFINKDANVSSEEDNFNIESGRLIGGGRHRSKFGVNKRETRLSGSGWSICKCDIGKGD